MHRPRLGRRGRTDVSQVPRWRETHDWVLWGNGALAAQPLALGNVGDTVAVLMDGKVAPVAEHDRVGVLALAVVADRAL